MAIAYNTDIVRSGLIFYADAANRKSYPGSGTTWFDISGNNNHCTLVNGPTFTTTLGGSFSFDGTNDHATFTSTLSIAQSAYSSTVEVIAYRNRNNAFEVMFGGGVQAAQQGFYFGFRATNGNNFMYAYYSNDQDGTTPRTNIAWNHYAATYNTSTSARFRYFNSTLLSPSQASGVTNTSANRFAIGAFLAASPAEFFQGNIAIVRIYNRALDQLEIRQNFEATRDRLGV